MRRFGPWPLVLVLLVGLGGAALVWAWPRAPRGAKVDRSEATLGELLQSMAEAAEADDAERVASVAREARAMAARLGDEAVARLDEALVAQVVALRRSRPATTVVVLREMLALRERVGTPFSVAVVYDNLGVCLGDLGRLDAADRVFTRAVAMFDAAGADGRRAQARSHHASVLDQMGETERALAVRRAALETARRVGLARDEIDEMRMGVAVLEGRLGRSEAAREELEVLLAEARARGDRNRELLCLGNLSVVLDDLGQVGTAISLIEEALRIAEALDDAEGRLVLLGSLADQCSEIGAFDRAERLYEETLALHEARGEAAAVAAVYVDMGTLAERQGDDERALERWEEGARRAEAVGHARWLANALGNSVSVLWTLGRHEEARARTERELALRRKLGDVPGEIAALQRLGRILPEFGEAARGMEVLEAALERAEAAGLPESAVRLRMSIALLALQLEQHARAVELMREALIEADRFTRDLDDASAAYLDDRWQQTAKAGLWAGLKLEDAAEVAWFMEAGRARQLARAVQAGAARRAAPELLARERAARRAAARALEDYERTTRTGNRRERQAALRRLQRAREAASGAAARIRREARVRAPAVDPRPVDLAALQAALAPDEVFVSTDIASMGLYLRVTREDVEVGHVNGQDTLRELATAAAGQAGRTMGPQASALGMHLTMQLRLGTAFRRILFSPGRLLAYVPPSVMFPGREVLLAPSATVYVRMQERKTPRGRGVLALGGVDYAGAAARVLGARPLAPLPGTRAEAEAVGDRLLLGEDATESALRRALAEERRWRAVHLACHGKADPDRIGGSALALGPDAENDGQLSVGEVFRLRVHADLVVLSACETARGRVLDAEGVTGLARAFLHAGAPRVLCSLWKVDDAATRALMTRFYELWTRDEGMGAGAALVAAQGHVRGLTREVVDEEASAREGRRVTKRVRPWSHPAYWAAWVLWGVPD